MGRIRFACWALAAAALSGCANLSQAEWEPEIRPCQVWIYDVHRRTAVCVDRPGYEDWAKQNLPTN